MHGQQLQKLGIAAGADVVVSQGNGSIRFKAAQDDRVPLGCVRLPGALVETAALGDLYGEIKVEVAH